MNNRDYIEELSTENDYCECSELSKLRLLRKKASALEAECDSLREGLDLENPTVEDRQSLLAYALRTTAFKSSVDLYERELNLQFQGGNLKLIPGQEETINCSVCGYEVDTVD